MNTPVRMLLLLALLMSTAGVAQTTAFTYQGYLTDAGTAAEGPYDFELALFSVDLGGTAIDVNAFDDVTVTGGLFQLAADFTGAPFEAGGSYWVEARVRDGASSGAYTPLLPRQPVNASPYAIAAQAVIAPLEVAGDANVQGGVTVGGDIAAATGQVSAASVQGGALTSTGPLSVAGNTDVDGGLTVGGDIATAAGQVSAASVQGGALTSTGPLSVAANADVGGTITVGGDITTVNEVRAQRVEADELFSDGAVDFVGGVAIQRFSDSVALLVENSGPTQPAARVVGELEVDGEIACAAASGCIGLEALQPGSYRGRDELYVATSAASSISPGLNGTATASCADANDRPLSGACPQTSMRLVGTEMLEWANPASPAGYRCRWNNPTTTTIMASAQIVCISVP